MNVNEAVLTGLVYAAIANGQLQRDLEMKSTMKQVNCAMLFLVCDQHSSAVHEGELRTTERASSWTSLPSQRSSITCN